MSDVPTILGSWLTAYLLHSTIFISLAFLAFRLNLVRSRITADLVWKAALVGGLISASLQPWYQFGMMEDVHVTTWLKPVAGFLAPPEKVITPNNEIIIGHPSRDLLQTTAQGLLILWPLAAAYLLFRLIRDHRRFLKAVGERRAVKDPGLLNLYRRLRRQTGVSSEVKLSVAPHLPGPVALNMKEICIPPRALTQLDGDRQRSMLAHELSHIRRADPRWLWFCGVLETLFFFQPLNLLARKRMQANAEFLCDHFAVTHTRSSLNMATCLAEVASWLKEGSAPRTVSPMAGDSSLVNRVSCILNPDQPSLFARPRKVAFILAAIVLMTPIILLPGFAFGERPLTSVWRSANIVTADHVTFHVEVKGVEEVGHRVVETRVTGNFRFGPNLEPIHISKGGYVDLVDKVNGQDHHFRLTPDGEGALVLNYEVNGKPQTADRRYFHFLYREMIREAYLFGPEYGELILQNEGREALEEELKVTRYKEAREAMFKTLDSLN